MEQINHLKCVFNAICNPKDWKEPIDATIDIIGCNFTLDDAVESIKFYTATEPKVSQVGETTYRITALGYRLGPAGDH